MEPVTLTPAIEKKPKLLDQVRNKIVKIRINWGEVHIYKAVKFLGGRWNERKKLWDLPYGDVIDFGLEGRIVYESKKTS